MKNFISVNAKYYKSSQSSKISNHNSRLSDIDYLLDDEDIKYQNKNIVYDNDNGGGVSLDENNLGGIGTYSDNIKKMRAIQASSFQKQFKKLQKKKSKALQKKYNYKKNEKENEIIEMVVSLSEEQAVKILQSGKDLMSGYDEFMKQIKKIYGLEPLSVDLHTDEGHTDKNSKVHYNIHAHCTFYNFDFEKEKTVLRNLKKKDWENMQDIAEDSFKIHDLDFNRGIKKKITGKKHLERIEFITQERLKEVKELYDTLNKEKNNLKELRKNYNKDSNKYKILTRSVKILQAKEKEGRSEARELKAVIKDKKSEIGIVEEKIENQEKWLNDTRAELKFFLLEHTQKNKNGKYELKNINEFYEEVVDLALYLSNYDLELEELTKQKQDNIQLKNKVSELESNTVITKDELSKKNNKVDELINKKNHLEDENYLYKKFVEDKNLKDEYNSFLQIEQQGKKVKRNCREM